MCVYIWMYICLCRFCRPTAFAVHLTLQDLLTSDDNFAHIYDRAFAKEALDLVVRENRISVNRSTTLGVSQSPAVSPAIHISIPSHVSAPLPHHSPARVEVKKSIHK